jgi:hypothetical protein
MWTEIEMIEISQNDEGLVSEVSRVSPSFARTRVKKSPPSADTGCTLGKTPLRGRKTPEIQPDIPVRRGKVPAENRGRRGDLRELHCEVGLQTAKTESRERPKLAPRVRTITPCLHYPEHRV